MFENDLMFEFDIMLWLSFYSLNAHVLYHMQTSKYVRRVLLLCGRIQQIQLLGRGMKGPEHDKLWNQLEAEIHLHRHKTVVRACRGRVSHHCQLPAPQTHVSQMYYVWL